MTSPAFRGSRAIVIGGGVIGLSVAWELARRGHQVLLLERGRIGRATSWAAAGILPPANLDTATDSLDRLRGLSHRLFPQWHQELLSQTGIDTGYRRCGGWYLADTPGERAAMIGMTHFWRDLGTVCEAVSPLELAAREPALAARSQREPVPAAWWVPDECQIRSPRYLQALLQANRLAGVELVEEAAVSGFHCSDSSVRVALAERTVSGDFAVLCGGVWSGVIASEFGLQASLIPIRGQMLLLRSIPQPLHAVVNVGHRYLVPREDGETLVGSNEEEVGFVEGTTPETLESLRQFAISLCPHLAGAEPSGSWSGLRPMTFDGFPMIGRMPGTSNLFVAAGHYRSGVHLSCGTAEVVANLVEGSDNVVDLAAFQVGKQQQLQRGN